ncbi:MAG: biotin transporter BioY [Pseudomonadota bacterium]
MMMRGGVLQEAVWHEAGAGIWIKRAVLVFVGVAALVIASKIRVPMWPVPATLQTLGVLSIGAAYGVRLGGLTLLAYLSLGALGLDVFAGSGAGSGLAYMAGPTGGYLAGFLAATVLMGALARRGWDRSVGLMALAMLLGTALIYVFGLAWMGVLFAADQGWAWVLQVGMVNFLLADALKIAIAAMLFPALWRSIGSARL